MVSDNAGREELFPERGFKFPRHTKSQFEQIKCCFLVSGVLLWVFYCWTVFSYDLTKAYSGVGLSYLLRIILPRNSLALRRRSAEAPDHRGAIDVTGRRIEYYKAMVWRDRYG